MCVSAQQSALRVLHNSSGNVGKCDIYRVTNMSKYEITNIPSNYCALSPLHLTIALEYAIKKLNGTYQLLVYAIMLI